MGYWLGDWIEDQGIRSIRDAKRALEGEAAFDGFLETMSAASAAAPNKVGQRSFGLGPGQGVVAGRQLDLSGISACSAPLCLMRQLDEGLATLWQYFDRVVVEGLSPERALSRQDWEGDWGAEQLILGHISVYLRAKEIGAVPFLDFRTKPYRFCASHYQEHAKELGLPTSWDDEGANAVVGLLERHGTLEVTRLPDGSLDTFFTHPLLEVGFGGRISAKDAKKRRPSKGRVARAAYRRMCLAMVGDVALAKDISYPLATDVHSVLHVGPSSDTSTVTPESVAISLNLPVLQGATSQEILRIREDHRPEFEKFRGALGLAIRERIEKAGSADPVKVARDVVKEYVEPELADITQKLTTARKALGLKAAPRVIVGGVLTTVGVLTAMPLLIGTGVTTVVSTGLTIDKFVDERREIQLSDMYFLVHAKRELREH